MIVDTPAVINCVKATCSGLWIGLNTIENRREETECVPHSVPL